MNPLNAYAASSTLVKPATMPVAEPKISAGSDFSNMVQDALKSSADLGRNAEGMSGNGLNEQVSLTDVVVAVSNAEVALQTVVSVRDKLVGSLQEIMRMPV